MKYTVYFDSGTTNSRAYLLDGGNRLIAQAQKGIGSKDSAAAGTNTVLIDGLYALYSELLANNGVSDSQVEELLLSGMVTSPYGIKEVPHAVAPISFFEFVQNTGTHYEETRFHRELRLVPGLKTVSDDLANVNNVRGEEIEVLGASRRLRAYTQNGPVAVVLPGSHTHTVLIEEDRFSDMLSNFTGELYAAIRKETILAPILNVQPESYDEDMIALGVKNLRSYGFTRALYICHAMRLFEKETPARRAAYAEGVILGGLVQSLEICCETKWQGLRQIVILADRKKADLYHKLLKQSRIGADIGALCIGNDFIPALEGARMILGRKKSL